MELHINKLQLYWRKVPQCWLWGVPVANIDSWGKQGGFPQPGHFWLCLNSGGLQRLRRALLHRQNSNVTVSMWSLTWICNESKAVREHSAVAHKEGFYGSNPCFCTKWEVGACCRASPWITLSLLRLGKLGLYRDTSALAAGLRAAALPCLHSLLSCLL